MIFRVPEVICRHGPEIVGNPDIGSRGGFQAAALHQADGGIGDRLGGQAMGGAGIEAEYVAGQMERTDLAASVVQELVGTHRAADHLIDILGWLAFAVDFLILAVGEFGRDYSRATGDDAELVGRRRDRRARGGENRGCRGGDRLGVHVAISSMRDGLAYRECRFLNISVDILRGLLTGFYGGAACLIFRAGPPWSPD